MPTAKPPQLPTMVTIVAIPSYYRTDAYVFVYKDSREERCTTTARYIVLTPASTEALTTRNTAIAKDVTAWGWRVYNTDPSARNIEKWFKKYEAAAKKNTWDDDIWRVWQREHGLKIAEEDAKRKDKEAGKKGGKERLVHGLKKAGVLFGKFAMTLDSDEQRLRQEEAGREEERRWKLADEQIVGRSEDSPDDPFADPPIARRHNVEEGDFKTGNLRGGGGSGAEAKASKPVPLTRHSYLLGG